MRRFTRPRVSTASGSDLYNDKTPEIYLQVDGYFLLDTNDTNTFFRQEYQFNDTLRWTKGRHQITMGADTGMVWETSRTTIERTAILLSTPPLRSPAMPSPTS